SSSILLTPLSLTLTSVYLPLQENSLPPPLPIAPAPSRLTIFLAANTVSWSRPSDSKTELQIYPSAQHPFPPSVSCSRSLLSTKPSTSTGKTQLIKSPPTFRRIKAPTIS